MRCKEKSARLGSLYKGWPESEAAVFAVLLRPVARLLSPEHRLLRRAVTCRRNGKSRLAFFFALGPFCAFSRDLVSKASVGPQVGRYVIGKGALYQKFF